MGVLGFQTFKLAFCTSKSLHWHAEILNSRDFNVSFPWIQSYWVRLVSFERESRSGVKQTHFQNLKKKGEWFFCYHRGTLSTPYKVGYQRSQRAHRDAKIYLLTDDSSQCHVNQKFENFTFSVQYDKEIMPFLFVLKPSGNSRWFSCRRWFNSLLMIKSLQSLRNLVSLASLVKTLGAFNCQNCDRTGSVVCQCNPSVQLKWESCLWPVTRARTVWPVQ